MCKVLEDMRNDVREETAQNTTVEHLKKLMDSMKWTIEQAMDALGISQSERTTYAGLVNKMV